MPADSRKYVFGAIGLPYLIVLVVAICLQLAGWLMVLLRRGLDQPRLVVISVGCTLAVISASVVREIIRLTRVDISELQSHHAQASTIGGFAAFLVVATINTAVIVWCIRIVMKRQS